MRRTPLALVSAFALACGADPAPPASPDAGARPAPDAGPTACASGTVRADSGDCEVPGLEACAAPFAPDPSGHGCVPILPDAPCAPGTRDQLGEATCAPVGWTTCPAGFARDALGFGCRDVSPTRACAGATYEVLGHAECQPLPGCDAPFPPADAALWVDPTFDEATLDATHHRTLTAALAAAADGAVIAVASATYAESLTVLRPLALVGRCAREVVLQGSLHIDGGRARVDGVSIVGGTVAVAAGAELTLRAARVDGAPDVGVDVAGALTLEDAVVRGTRAGRGVVVRGEATLRRAAIVAHKGVGVDVVGAAARARLEAVVVSATALDAGRTVAAGVQASEGAVVEVFDSATIANQRAGLRLASGARARVERTAVRDTAGGAGVVVRDGAALEARELSVDGSREYALAVFDGATATVAASVIQGTRRALFGSGAAIAVAAERGRVVLEDAALLDNDDRAVLCTGGRVAVRGALIAGTHGDLAPGVGVNEGGVAAVDGATVRDSGAAGAILGSGGGQLTLTRTLVDATRGFPGAQVGAGLVVNSGTITVDRSHVRDSASLGLVIGNVRGDRARATVIRSRISGTRGREGLDVEHQEGFGVWVSSGSTLALSHSELVDNMSAGLGVHYRARATAERVLIRDTVPDRLGNYGHGVYAEGGLDLRDSEIRGCTTLGVQAHSAFSRVHLSRVLIDATRPKSDGVFGHGLAASFGGTLVVQDSEVRGSAGAGLVVESGAAIVASSLVIGNAIGVHVQAGTVLQQVAAAPEEPPAQTVLITDDTRFIDNGTRTGLGTLPLPEPLGGPGG